MISPLPALTPSEREAYEERAAIMEYDGGLSRADAEREAMREIALARIRNADTRRPNVNPER